MRLMLDTHVLLWALASPKQLGKDARAAKDFTRGDAVLDRMAARGIELRDTPQGTVWSVKFTTED